MTIGRQFAGHPPDEVPPQEFRAETPICPACGYETSASFKWCSGGRHCPRGELLEHLHRQCQQCSYEWLEPCLDPGVVKFE